MQLLQQRQSRAFTLVELLIALIISSVLIAITSQIYSVFRLSIVNDQAKAAISQNGRIALDRMSREIRQAPTVVTELPASPTDTSVAQPNEIEFEDGHTNDLTYKRYYLSGTTLQMQTKEYYFANNPSARVQYNQLGSGGTSPVSAIISTQDIADSVQSIVFYGDTVIQVVITTTDSGNQQYVLQTSMERRN